MNQFVWVWGPGWKVVGRARIGAPVDHIVSQMAPGTAFSITVGGLVVFSGVLGQLA